MRAMRFCSLIDYIVSDNSPQSQGLVASLIAKILNNLQVTVKNVHVRYEDKLSVPGVRSTIQSCKMVGLMAVVSIRSPPVSHSPALLHLR